MAQIKAASLVIQGTGDKIVPIEPSAERLVDLVPQTKLIEYDGAPHALSTTVVWITLRCFLPEGAVPDDRYPRAYSAAAAARHCDTQGILLRSQRSAYFRAIPSTSARSPSASLIG